MFVGLDWILSFKLGWFLTEQFLVVDLRLTIFFKTIVLCNNFACVLNMNLIGNLLCLEGLHEIEIPLDAHLICFGLFWSFISECHLSASTWINHTYCTAFMVTKQLFSEILLLLKLVKQVLPLVSGVEVHLRYRLLRRWWIARCWYLLDVDMRLRRVEIVNTDDSILHEHVCWSLKGICATVWQQVLNYFWPTRLFITIIAF